MSPARTLLREHTADRPETHDFIVRMRQVLNDYDDRVLIGEAYLPIDRLMRYYGEALAGFHLPFNFHLIGTPWQPRAIAQLIREYEGALPEGGWPNWVLGNHDKSRVATRLGGLPEARLAAMLLLTLRGTPTLYNGEEIGMHDVPITPDRVRDPWEKRVPGLGLGRDPCRTPLQWSAEPQAGFTRGEPWLPVADDFAACNVEAQIRDPASILSLYHSLLRLRRAEPALSIGRYRELNVTEQALVYERSTSERLLIVALNFSAAPCSVALPGRAEVIFSSTGRPPSQSPAAAQLSLQPFEGIVACA
jgi:alpha-glucosidase